MSFTPSPGSLVRLRNGSYGLVAKVTPKGDGDLVVVIGYAVDPHKTYEYAPGVRYAPHEITEVIHEPEASNTESRPK